MDGRSAFRRCVDRRAGQRVYDRPDVSGSWRISTGWKKGGAVVGAPPLNWSATRVFGISAGRERPGVDKRKKRLFAVTDGDTRLSSIRMMEDRKAAEPQEVRLARPGNAEWDRAGCRRDIYVSDVPRNEIWVIANDGSQRILIANKANAPPTTTPAWR